MASEVELERLVVRLVGDAKDYIQQMNQSAKATQENAAKVDAQSQAIREGNAVWAQTRTPIEQYLMQLRKLKELQASGAISQETFNRAIRQSKDRFQQQTKEVKEGAKGYEGIGIQAEKAKLAAMRFGQVSGLPPETLMQVQQYADFMNLGSVAVQGLTKNMTALNGALVSGGIGLAVAGVAALISMFSKTEQEVSHLEESIKGAFASVADGSKTAKQAVEGFKVKFLEEGFKNSLRYADLLNEEMKDLQKWTDITGSKPWFKPDIQIGDIKNVFGRQIEGTIKEAEQGRKRIKEILEMPVVQQFNKEVGTDRAKAGADELIRSLEDEADRFGMSEGGAKAYALAQDLAAKANISLLESLELLRPQLDKIQELTEKAAKEKEQADKIKGLEDAYKNLGDELKNYGKTQEEILALEAEALGKTDLAEKIRQRGHALKFLQQKTDDAAAAEERLKAMQEEAKGITERMRTPLEAYNAEVEKLTKLRGMLGEDTFSRAMKDAKDRLDAIAKAARGAYQELQKLDGVLSGSQESKFRRQAYLDRLAGGDGAGARGEALGRPPPAMAPAGIPGPLFPAPAPGGPMGMNDPEALTVLRKVRDVLVEIRDQKGVKINLGGIF